MPKVFIPNKGGHDYSAAADWGEPIICCEGLLPRFALSNMFRILEPFIKESSSNDYIMLTSLPTLCCLMCSMFAVKHGRLNLLLFKDGRYIERCIVFDDRTV